MSNDELATSTRVVAPRDLVYFERRTKLLLAGGLIFITTL